MQLPPVLPHQEPPPPAEPDPGAPLPPSASAPPPRGIWESWGHGRLLLWGLFLLASNFVIQVTAFQLLDDLFLAVAAGSLLGVLLPCHLLARTVNGSLASEFRLDATRPSRLVWAGLVALGGLIPTSLLADLSIRIHPVPQDWFDFYTEQLPQTPLAIVLAGITVVLIAPVAEEILFRGIIHRLAGRIWGSSAAAILSALAFALLHGEPWYLLALFGLGLLLSYIYEATGSLTPCCVTHGVHNGISFYLLLHEEDLATGGSGDTGVQSMDIWLMGGSLLLLVFACGRLARSD